MTSLLEPAVAAPAPSRPAGGPGRRQALLTAGAVWSVVTVAHLAVQMLAWLPRGGSVPAAVELLTALNKWDTEHYLRIAESGYRTDPGSPAFFPLYPLLIRATDAILPGGALVAALLIAKVAAFGALATVYRLAEIEFGPRVAQRATWYLALFPTGFFLFIGYNESLFILFMVGALYAGRRGCWWWAGCLGALASATRLFGVLLMLPLAVEYLRQAGWRFRRLRPDVLGLALVPAGVAIYSVYCLLALGDPLAFSAAQEQWGREYTVPGAAWVSAVDRAQGGLLSPDTLGAVTDAGTFLLAVCLLMLAVVGPVRFRRDQIYLTVHGALSLVLLMSTTSWFRPMMSSARYVLEVLAIFLVLGRLGAHPVVDRAILVVGTTLHATFLLIFIAGTFFVG